MGTEPLRALDELPLGISTEACAPKNSDWYTAIRAARAWRLGAVELSALTGMQLRTLVSVLAGDRSVGALAGIGYISLHMPVEQVPPPRELVAALAAIPARVETIIAHPDLVADVALFRPLGVRVSLENMDGHKPTGRTRGELGPFFAAFPEAGFCFDVAHAWSIDPTLRLAHELLDAYGHRLRQVHLSGIDGDGIHRPTTRADLARYWPVLASCRSVPWILETPMLAADHRRPMR